MTYIIENKKPVLGLPALIAYGLVFMIPIAPVAIYGYVNQDSHGLVPLVYLIGALAMLFTALSYKKMSQTFPVSGSVFSYVGAALGKPFGFITGWIALMDYVLIPALVYRLSAAWLQDILPFIPAAAWIISVALFNTWINCRGIMLTTRLSFVLLAMQIICLIAFLICAISYLFHQNQAIAYIRPLYHPDYFNMTFIGTSLSLALLNYLGFDGISTLAEEAHEPQYSIGNAIIITLVLIAILFIVQTYAAALVSQHLYLNKETAFFDIAYAIGGKWLYGLFIIVNIISIGVASALVTQAASARLLNVMAREKILPFHTQLSKIHSHFHTPAIATSVTGLLAIALSLGLASESLISLVSWGGLSAYLLLNYSVIHHFFLHNKAKKNTWFTALILPLLAFCFIAFVWLHFAATTLIAGGIFVCIGMLIYCMRFLRLESL